MSKKFHVRRYFRVEKKMQHPFRVDEDQSGIALPPASFDQAFGSAFPTPPIASGRYSPAGFEMSNVAIMGAAGTGQPIFKNIFLC